MIEESVATLLLPKVLVLVQEHLITEIDWQFRQFSLSIVVGVLVVLPQEALGCKVLESALPVPRSFRHRCIDLLQVEFILNRFFVNVRDHVWRLDEWHRKRRPHTQSERAFRLLLRKVHFYWLKLLAKSTFDVVWLDHNSAIAILLNLLEVLQVYGQVLVEFVSLAQLLINHGPHQVQLLHVLRVFKILHAISQLFVDE